RVLHRAQPACRPGGRRARIGVRPLSPVDQLTALAAIMAVWMCGVMRINNLVLGLALQTVALGLVAAVIGAQRHLPQYFFLAGAVVAIKALAIPFFLSWTADRIGTLRDQGTILGPSLALLAACGALTAGYFFADQVAGPGATDP